MRAPAPQAGAISANRLRSSDRSWAASTRVGRPADPGLMHHDLKGAMNDGSLEHGLIAAKNTE